MAEEDTDAGFTLVEALVALLLITGAVTAMLGMITRSIQTHRTQRDSATAERLATTGIETAHNSPWQTLASSLGTQTSTTGAFTSATTVSMCSASDPAASCTPPAAGAPAVVHLHVQVSWQEAGAPKHLDLTTAVNNPASTTPASAGSVTLANLTGAAAAGVSASVTSLSLSPKTVAVDANGHPVQPVTVTAAVTGLTTGTAFPLTWTDDTGGHQATMSPAGTNAQGQPSWTATIPTTGVTRLLTSSGGSVVFAATVPGTQSVPTTTLTLTPTAAATAPAPAPTAVCSSPLTVTLAPTTTKTLIAVPLTCTTTALAASDTVMVNWPTTNGTASGRLASTDGQAWSLTLPAGTPMRAASSETFSYTATRAGDGVAAATATTSVLA